MIDSSPDANQDRAATAELGTCLPISKGPPLIVFVVHDMFSAV